MEQTYTPFGTMPVERAEAEVRATFIRQTYLHVALATLLFVIIEAIFLSVPAIVNIGLQMTQGMTWLLVLGGFMFVTNYAERWAIRTTDKGQQYMALGLFVAAEAFIFVPLLYMAMYFTNSGPDLLMQAAVVTLTLFSGLTAIAMFSGADFSFLKGAITLIGFIAIGLIVAGILFGFNLGLWFSVAMVFLAGMSILYQTSKVMQNYHSGQYVAAALGLFASLMLLFWYIISIFMSRD